MRLFPRLVAFLVLAVVVELWVNHHLGLGRATPWVALVLSTASGLGWIFESGQIEVLVAALRARLHAWLTPKRLIILYAIVLPVLLLFSSVTVIPDAGAAGGAVSLAAVDGRTQRQGQLSVPEPLGFFVPTSPFGRSFRLRVDAYVEHVLTVYPIVGVRVTPERDLRRSPSVLLRPPVYALRYLDTGSITVAWRQGTITRTLATASGHRSAFLIGHAQPIPVANSGVWRLELEGERQAPNVVSQTLLEWIRPHVLAPSAPLAPGMVLMAEVRTAQQRVVARAEVTLGSETFVDVGMQAVEE